MMLAMITMIVAEGILLSDAPRAPTTPVRSYSNPPPKMSDKQISYIETRSAEID